MRTLTEQALLAMWESSLERKPVERGIAMLRTVQDGSDAGDPARLPIGRRDARLLALREQAFGQDIAAVTTCPRCLDAVEARFRVENLRLPSDEPPPSAHVEVDEYAIDFRLPDSLDLMALDRAHDADPTELQRALVERCILNATRGSEPVAAQTLPGEAVEAVARGIGEADPQADIELAVACAACGHQWPVMFDIEEFLWNELEAWAARTLYEVHQLASAYGWTEQEILSVSPERRNLYLNMIAE